MSPRVPEPPNGTIVAWYDKNGDPWVVLHRDDDATNENGYGTELRWWFPVYDQTEDPQAWAELCDDMDGFRGPVVLVPEAGEGR